MLTNNTTEKSKMSTSIIDKEYMNNKLSIDEWRNQRKVIEKNEEPLLQDEDRNSLYPIRHPGIWSWYKLHHAAHWTSFELTYHEDRNDWERLTPQEQHYIKTCLAFFAMSDFIVVDNQEKDSEEVSVLEYKFMNADKIARENVHSTTYADLLNAFVTDDTELETLRNAVVNMPTVAAKSKWLREYINNGTFVERTLATSIVEGIFFSGSFCAIFWLKKRGMMAKLCDSNEFISRDEGLHRDFSSYIYREYTVNTLPEELVIRTIKEAVEIEKEFVKVSLPVNLIGMNSELMCQYIEYVADSLCKNLIGKTIYNVALPFDWMNAISLTTKTDFFAHRPTDYANTNVLASRDEASIRFNDDTF